MDTLERLHEVIERLTPENGLNVRLRLRNETPLIWAVSEGYHDIAVTLIEAGADLDAQNSDGNTALLRAACEGRTALANLLIQVGALLDLQNADGYTALILAARRGNGDIVDLLRTAGADPRIVTKLGTTVDNPGHSPKKSLAGPRDPKLERQIVDAIRRVHGARIEQGPQARSINLDAEDRFVPTEVLREAYVHYDASKNPMAPNYVTLDDDLELGIVSSAVPEISRAISSLLCRSLEDARNDKGGYLPTDVVRRVQREIISPWGVAYLWGITGHRFVLSRPAPANRREIIATILVGRSRDTVFFFTGRYNNLRHSTMHEVVDLEQPNAEDAEQKWFDRFSFPAIERFKPPGYHHIANFVVAKEHRREGLSRLMLDKIVEKYSLDHITLHDGGIEHSQHLLCGRGFWQIGDPPWLVRMERLGFYLRWGAESFFIEHEWARLPTIVDRDTGASISNVDYNASYRLPDRYVGKTPATPSAHHLTERVPDVIRLSRDPRAKLQYFQMMFDFT